MKIIIFDLDNTLYPYNPCHDYAMKIVIGKFSKKIKKSTSKTMIEFSKARKQVKKVFPESAQGHHRLLYFIRILENQKIIDYDFALQMHDLYWEAYFKKMKLFDGVITLFKKLKKKKIKIAILTDHLTDLQIKKLSHLEIIQYIDLLVTSEQIGINKPSSLGFLHILSMFNIKKSEALVVGDSLKKDIKAAEKLKIKALWFNHEREKTKRIKNCFQHFSDLANGILNYE